MRTFALQRRAKHLLYEIVAHASQCYSAFVRSCVAILALAACNEAAPPPKAAPAAPAHPVATADAATAACEQLPFAENSPVHEASGAAWLDIDGKLMLVVISDSGNQGEYAIIEPESGTTRERGKLPLGKTASDDVEGLASRGDKLYGLTSAGWMRVWQRKGKGFDLVDGPYAIGPVDAQSKSGGKAPKGVGNVCPANLGNCGRNFEGLAMSPTAAYACAKTDGRLYPLAEHDGRFVADFTKSVAVTKPDSLGDCAFSDRGVLLVGDNWFGQVYRVDGTTVTPVAQLGIGFPEVIAARGDVVYRMSDMGGSPSLMAKFRCPAIAR